MSEFLLISEIIKLSNNKTWDIAKLEWKIEEIYITDNFERCLCGHYPIVELCFLRNIWNHNKVLVGNCCVKKFLKIPSEELFEGFRRIQKDPLKSLNNISIEYSKYREWINKWEYKFYLNIIKKRKLSKKQMGIKIRINQQVLRFVKK